MSTDDQLKDMLRGIHEREGTWGSIDAETEIVRIGQTLGLDEDQSLELFKQAVDGHYIDLGRIWQAGGSTGRKGQPVGFGKINVEVGADMGLTYKGRALIGV